MIRTMIMGDLWVMMSSVEFTLTLIMIMVVSLSLGCAFTYAIMKDLERKNKRRQKK